MNLMIQQNYRRLERFQRYLLSGSLIHVVTFPHTPTCNNNIKRIYFKTHVSDSSELWLRRR